MKTSKENSGNEIESIEATLEGVDGFFGNIEGEFLYKHALRCVGEGVILEIGSWKGRSTIWLANVAKKLGKTKVFAIDPHTGSPEHHEKFGTVYTFDVFMENIKNAGIEEFVVPIRKTSQEAAAEWDGTPIKFLWIDGDHSYDMVKLDFELWSPFLAEGGIVAFHDTDRWEGPKKFVEERIFKANDFVDVAFFETITVATKKSNNSMREKFQNRYTLLVKRTYQTLRHSKFPRPKFIKIYSRKVIQKFGRS